MLVFMEVSLLHFTLKYSNLLSHCLKNGDYFKTLVFPGPWRSAHIDDLRQSKDIVSDIKALQNITISEMFETEISHHEGN